MSDFVRVDDAAVVAADAIEFNRTITTTYGKVVFEVEEFYPVGKSLEFVFEVPDKMMQADNDWIGVYKVGWRSPKSDCSNYQYVRNQIQLKQKHFRICFPASNLPTDCNDYYQLCYVTEAGQVRGASVPFVFDLAQDRLVTVQDEHDSDMMIIKTQKAALKDDLEREKQQSASFRAAIRERDERIRMAQLELERRTAAMTVMEQQSEEISAQNEENGEMVKAYKQASEELAARVAQLEEALRKMQAEKEVAEQAKTEAHATIDQMAKDISEYRNQLDEVRGDNSNLRNEMAMLLENNTRMQTDLTACRQQNQADERNIIVLQENIHEISGELERYERIEAELTTQIEQLTNMLEASRDAQDILREEVNQQNRDIEELKASQMKADEMKQEQDGPLFALQLAHSNLKGRLEKRTSEVAELRENRKTLIAELQAAQTRIEDKTKENKDLIAHLRMSRTIYHEKYIECSTVKKQLKKLKAETGTVVAVPTPPACNERPERKEESESQNATSSDWADESAIRAAVDLVRLQNENDALALENDNLWLEKKNAESQVALMAAEIERLKLAIENTGQNMQPPPISNLHCLDYVVDQVPYVAERAVPRAPQPPIGTVRGGDIPQPSERVSPLEPMMLSPPKADEPKTPPQPPPREVPVAKMSAPSQQAVLPPPLQPELTPEAKKAAVQASFQQHITACVATADDIFPGFEVPSAPPCVPPPAVCDDVVDGPEEERFLDAPGEPQRMCPVCQMVFPLDTNERVFSEHIDTHYAAVCPVCSQGFSDADKGDAFISHVNSHFED